MYKVMFSILKHSVSQRTPVKGQYTEWTRRVLYSFS